MKRYLICCGDPNNINCWSGIPYHILDMAKELSFKLEGIKLDPEKLSNLRLLWNLKRFFYNREYSGFQFSNFFINNLSKQIKINDKKKVTLISNFPLLPNITSHKRWNIFYYIDATNNQIFEDYKCFKFISKEYKKEILSREKINYYNAKLIFCMSKWTRDSLINDYAVPREKIMVLPGGANIQKKYLKDHNIKDFWPEFPSKHMPLRIGLLGKDWERKGGRKILDVVKMLNNKSIPTVIRVIGISDYKLPKNEYIQNVGFIDKNKRMDKFISEVKSWHFGTLFSEAEAFGISNRECFALGVPVICHDVGGIRSTFPEDDINYGFIFKSNEKPKIISDWIADKINDYSSYINLRKKIASHTYQFTWEPTIKKMFQQISLIEKY